MADETVKPAVIESDKEKIVRIVGVPLILGMLMIALFLIAKHIEGVVPMIGVLPLIWFAGWLIIAAYKFLWEW
jgi:hypothetical protein